MNTLPRWFLAAVATSASVVALSSVAAAVAVAYAATHRSDAQRWLPFTYSSPGAAASVMDTRTGTVCSAGGDMLSCMAVPSGRIGIQKIELDSRAIPARKEVDR